MKSEETAGRGWQCPPPGRVEPENQAGTNTLTRTLNAMRYLLERIEGRLDPQRQSRQSLWYVAHRFGTRDRKLAKQYILKSQVRKLHLGCGWNLLPGWLNMDNFPRCREALYLDVRRPFFFSSDTFDYIFSEHMIEHMSYHDGVHMLAECHRILKGFGKIRISTPDLAFLMKLYRADKSSLQREYVTWANRSFLKDTPEDNEVFVINNFMRNWSHIFIYDENTLKTAMVNAGFTDITKHTLQNSKEDALCRLENLARIPTHFLELETITLEGTKAG